MKLQSIVTWCTDHLSPMAWQRVATQLSPYFQEKYGWSIAALFKPQDDMRIDEEDLVRVNEVVASLYGQTMEV